MKISKGSSREAKQTEVREVFHNEKDGVREKVI
jgi:hypothetical protein